VREESHLDDMRAAIRGDFERLEERRGEQELMRVADEEPDAREPEQEADVDLPQPDLLEPAPATEPEPAAQAAEGAPELRGEAAHKTSWLDRLLGR
jgi:hypothetical protein